MVRVLVDTTQTENASLFFVGQEIELATDVANASPVNSVLTRPPLPPTADPKEEKHLSSEGSRPPLLATADSAILPTRVLTIHMKAMTDVYYLMHALTTE